MPLALAQLVAPAHTAVVTQECQGAVLGADPVMPNLLGVARKGMIDTAARLLRAARAAEVPVIHCVIERRADGRGSNRNARMFAAGRRGGAVRMLAGTADAEPIPEFGPETGDIVLRRLHGTGPMYGTDLASVLMNLGVTTIVGIGVSLNVGMISFATCAVSAGFQFVMPRDAVAGWPEDYAQAMLEHSYALLATLPTADELIACWKR
jgi:nicotinamidase-related amidase